MFPFYDVQIVDLEDGILQLKEDLIQERTEARQEKKRLKRAVVSTYSFCHLCSLLHLPIPKDSKRSSICQSWLPKLRRTRKKKKFEKNWSNENGRQLLTSSFFTLSFVSESAFNEHSCWQCCWRKEEKVCNAQSKSINCAIKTTEQCFCLLQFSFFFQFLFCFFACWQQYLFIH